jgi:hypothetical protein
MEADPLPALILLRGISSDESSYPLFNQNRGIRKLASFDKKLVCEHTNDFLAYRGIERCHRVGR